MTAQLGFIQPTGGGVKFDTIHSPLSSLNLQTHASSSKRVPLKSHTHVISWPIVAYPQGSNGNWWIQHSWADGLVKSIGLMYFPCKDLKPLLQFTNSLNLLSSPIVTLITSSPLKIRVGSFYPTSPVSWKCTCALDKSEWVGVLLRVCVRASVGALAFEWHHATWLTPILDYNGNRTLQFCCEACLCTQLLENIYWSQPQWIEFSDD